MTREHWTSIDVTDTTSRITNRYGNFVRFGSLHVYEQGPFVMLEGNYKEGARAAALVLSHADAVQLRDTLMQLLPPEAK